MARGAYADPEDFIRFINTKLDLESDRDWNEELLFQIAVAINAAKKLQGDGIDLRFRNKKLILPWLEKAWREALYIRIHLPKEYLEGKKVRGFLDRFGNVIKEK